MEEKFFPVFISMKNRQIWLIGAGNIALRRAAGLLDFGAVLTVIAPEISAGFYELQRTCGEERLILEKKKFVPGSIPAEGLLFVLSATDDRETDRAVYAECKEKGISVNIASDQTMCDFQFPALIQQENLVIGVNSGGRDHRKVRRISEKIRKWIGSVPTMEE